MSRVLPWVEKYRPRRLSDLVGHEQAIRQVLAWLNSWRKGAPEKKALFLYGPPGVGKTTLVHVLAREKGYELIELNASDLRRASDIRRVVSTALNTGSLFGAKGKIIFFDEVDGMSDVADKGGLDEILKIIKESRIPVILAANDPWSPKLKPLRDISLMVRLNRLRTSDVVKILKRICEKEGIKADPAALRLLAEKNEGDLRSAINDLQAIAEGRKIITVDDVKYVTKRYREYDPFTILSKLFNATRAEEAKALISQSMLSYDELILWIHENIPYYYRDPEEIAKAYEALSKADVYMGRIIKSGNWKLLSYVIDFMTAGVALAKKRITRKFVRFQFPQKLVLMARSKEFRRIRDAIASRIAAAIHESRRYVLSELIFYLRAIFQLNPKQGALIAKKLGFNRDMVRYVAGDPNIAKQVIKYMSLVKA